LSNDANVIFYCWVILLQVTRQNVIANYHYTNWLVKVLQIIVCR